MTNEKMIRDALGSPVPQVYNEDLKDYVVSTVDGSIISRGDINFNRTKLLRDLLGSVIPQLWDPVNNKWVVDTGQGREGSGGGTVEVIDNLDSQSTSSALSAKQGYLLNEKIGDISSLLDAINGEVIE